MKIAVNGFGRIGRAVTRIGLDKGVEIVAINDLSNAKILAHLLKYDSVHGIYNKNVKAGEDFIKVGNKKILVFSEKDPANLPWKKLGVDIVIESTGVFRDKIGAGKHISAGAKKVIITGPGKELDATIVLGINEGILKRDYKIISMSSCTTNCLAPIVKILDDEFGIEKGFMTTVHAYTNDQVIVDGPHKDLRRARTAGINLVPTTSGAADSVGEVIPKLKGKLDGLAIRAPVACGSITDFVAVLSKEVTIEQVNKAVKKLADGKLKGILEYSEEEIVSSDIVNNQHSSIFDSKLTKVKGNLVKVFSWYDNEWGYSNRVIDLLKYIR